MKYTHTISITTNQPKGPEFAEAYELLRSKIGDDFVEGTIHINTPMRVETLLKEKDWVHGADIG